VTLPASDNFNRAGPALGANWTQMNAFFGDIVIETSIRATGAASETTTLDTQARWSADAFANDHSAQCTVAVFGDVFNTRVGVIARASGSNPSGTDTRQFYAVFAFDNGGANNFQIVKVLSGAAITVLHQSTRTIAANDTLRIEVQGTSIRGYHNGALVDTQVDSALSSGSAGVLCGAGCALDNFEADNIAVVPPAYGVRNDGQYLHDGAIGTRALLNVKGWV
jgi:hypothetical protein